MPLVRYSLPHLAARGLKPTTALDDARTVKEFDSREGIVKLVKTKGKGFSPGKLRIIKSVRHRNIYDPPHEAKVISRLVRAHDNIIEVYAAELTRDGQGITCFEYCTGGDLFDQIKRFDKMGMTVPPIFALHIWIGMGEALAFLHHGLVYENGKYTKVPHDTSLVHCDIKEDNVFLRFPGQIPGLPDIVLSDFGLSNYPWNALPGNGCVPYMSPECKFETVPHLSHKTDIYSLGVMMRRILHRTGSTWKTGSNHRWAIVNGLYKGLGFTDILQGCLIADRHDRRDFSSAHYPGLLGYILDFRHERKAGIKDGAKIDPKCWASDQ